MSPRPTAKQQPNNSQTAAKQPPEGLQQPNDHPTNLVKARDHGGGVEVSAEARVQAQGGRAGCEGDEVVRARGDATRDGTEAAGADREASAEVCTVGLLEAGDVGREEQGRGLAGAVDGGGCIGVGLGHEGPGPVEDIRAELADDGSGGDVVQLRLAERQELAERQGVARGVVPVGGGAEQRHHHTRVLHEIHEEPGVEAEGAEHGVDGGEGELEMPGQQHIGGDPDVLDDVRRLDGLDERGECALPGLPGLPHGRVAHLLLHTLHVPLVLRVVHDPLVGGGGESVLELQRGARAVHELHEERAVERAELLLGPAGGRGRAASQPEGEDELGEVLALAVGRQRVRRGDQAPSAEATATLSNNSQTTAKQQPNTSQTTAKHQPNNRPRLKSGVESAAT